MEVPIMSNATSVPQSTLFRTDADAFADALRAVAPDIFREAEEYRARAQELGIIFNQDEAVGRALHVLLELVGPDEDTEPAYDAAAMLDYNDDELLHCGIER
jgi:hypothetical protein